MGCGVRRDLLGGAMKGRYMKFEIKHRMFGDIIFSVETESWKLAVTRKLTLDAFGGLVVRERTKGGER